MNVTVNFTTQLKAAIGTAEQDITLNEGSTVGDAIKSLAEQHAEPFSRFVLSDGQLMPSIMLSLNDRQVDQQAILSHGDVLTLLSAISGG